MVSDTIKNWDQDIVDVPSTTLANLIATLNGGESITIKSLAGASDFHFIGTKAKAEDSKGYKLAGGETMTLTLPITFGRNNKIEIFAMATNAGDDVTFFKLIDLFPETGAST